MSGKDQLLQETLGSHNEAGRATLALSERSELA